MTIARRLSQSCKQIRRDMNLNEPVHCMHRLRSERQPERADLFVGALG